MATEIPGYIKKVGQPKSPKMMREPRPAPSTQPAPAGRVVGASSHNTFRPDIYRVSEGYLN